MKNLIKLALLVTSFTNLSIIANDMGWINANLTCTKSTDFLGNKAKYDVNISELSPPKDLAPFCTNFCSDKGKNVVEWNCDAGMSGKGNTSCRCAPRPDD